MSPTTPPSHPSQAVERIREIIVGRRLDHLEQRLARVETQGVRTAVPAPATDLRLATTEAQLEALRDQLKKLADHQREENANRDSAHREQVQRMAAIIQQAAAGRAETALPQATARLEQKLTAYLGTWQASLQQHLAERENRLLATLKQEVAALKTWTEERIAGTTAGQVTATALDARLARIASAAKALAAAIHSQPAAPITPDSDECRNA